MADLSRRDTLRAIIGGMTAAAGGIFVAEAGAAPASWRRYPTNLYDFKFPEIEGVTADGTDTWYIAGFLTGENSGRRYAFITIFCKNRPVGDLIHADFYTFALFDLDTGRYGTYTLLDLPPDNILTGPKLAFARGHLDLAAETPGGRAIWTTRRTPAGTLDPFRYHLGLSGTDQYGQLMRLDVDVDPQNPPTVAGGRSTRGVITCFGQSDTRTYFQTGTHFRGRLTWGGRTEAVTGTQGHIDRQLFPAYAGVDSGLLERDRSHEWRSAHLGDGTDLSIWRQFNRTEHDSIQPFTGATRYLPRGDRTLYAPDLQVSYSSYVKWPASVRVLIPPPSPNLWMPGAHTVRAAGLDLELRCVPLVLAPAHGLPVEYMIGPVHWEGRIAGQAVSGLGFFERTLALYRDWELADVLRVTVTNLPPTAYSASSPSPVAFRALAESVAAAAARSDRMAVLAGIETRLRPAVGTLYGPDRTELAELLNDLEQAPSH